MNFATFLLPECRIFVCSVSSFVASCCFWTTCILMSGDQSKLQTGVKAMQAGHLTQMTYQGERIRFCFYLQSNSCQLKPIILNYLILIRGLGCVTLWWNIDHSGATGQIFSVSPGSWKYPSQQYTTEIIFCPKIIPKNTTKNNLWAIFSL